MKTVMDRLLTRRRWWIAAAIASALLSVGQTGLCAWYLERGWSAYAMVNIAGALLWARCCVQIIQGELS